MMIGPEFINVLMALLLIAIAGAAGCVAQSPDTMENISFRLNRRACALRASRRAFDETFKNFGVITVDQDFAPPDGLDA